MNDILISAFEDELEKTAFFKRLREKLRERALGPRVEEPVEEVEEPNRFRSVFNRMGDFFSGFAGAEGTKNKAWGMGMFPGPASIDQQLDAVYNATERLGDTSQGVEVNFQPYGASEYFPDEGIVNLTQGQLGTAYHEGGHVAGIESMAPAARDAYLNLINLSYRMGPKAGLALVPNALMDPPGRRRALSKWGPLAALLPSLPMLFEEGRANIIGGSAARKQGDLGVFLNEALPGYIGYAAQAAAVPLGLHAIHRSKERQIADAQRKAQEAIELELSANEMPKAAHVVVGFADELEKFGGLKGLMAAGLGGVALGALGPSAITKSIMSGAQNFNAGVAPRFGGGHIAAQRGNFPLAERIAFNPVVQAAREKVVPQVKKIPGALRTAADFYTGG